MANMRAIPGWTSLLVALATMGHLFKAAPPGINRGYHGGGSGVGVTRTGRKATAPKPHLVSKIERRRRKKQSIRDRKFRYHTP